MKKTTTLLMTSLSLLALGCDKGGGATNPETDATTGASIPVKDGDEGKAGILPWPSGRQPQQRIR